MQVYQIDCDRFRKRNSGRRAETPSDMDSRTLTFNPTSQATDSAATQPPQQAPPAIQGSVKSTAGAHNKNQVLERIRGAALEMTIAEVCSHMQQIAQIELDQKQRFVKTHKGRLPADDKTLTDPDALCLSLCFHTLYSYKPAHAHEPAPAPAPVKREKK